ncbi:MAG: polymerase sigma-70 factor, subfamily [Frankiales bacterium]|jgi:RNA polymerase sigma-70 factor (ECF subfamily)|nr:polymerase sigma-70 factor, subfamily [Frankiales bacterium]
MTAAAFETTGRAEFGSATEPYRRELLAHCYRMIGSIHDAEDLVQETYVRAWRAYDRFEGRSSVRLWLYAIATRVCLTALESRARRPLPSGLGPPEHDPGAGVAVTGPSEAWLQPAPDALLGTGSEDPAGVVVAREGVRLAFVAALQHLPARQRAVLILRDVLAWHAAEVAELLGTSTIAVNSTLQRARAHLGTVMPAPDELAEPDDPATRAVVDRYVAAFERADAAGLAELLRADVELEMPPNPVWFAGRDTVVSFFDARVLGCAGRWRLVPIRANGQPALAAYGQSQDGCMRAHGIQVLDVVDGKVARIVAFNDASLVPMFGLPTVLSR